MNVPVHHSWLVSPYSAKTRSYLRYKGIPFEDRAPSARQLNGRIKKAVGRAIMPTVELPDGTWLQDSSLIIDHFEAAHPEPGIVPPGPTQRLAALLIELYADEWMSLADLHYRWNTPENAAYAIDEFARNGLPGAPLFLSRPVARKIASKMQGYRPKLGITEETGPGIEAVTERLLANLDAHLAEHPFLLGGRPCIGDFALYGPLWAHLFRDPGTTALFDEHAHVRRWLDALRQGATPGPTTGSRPAWTPCSARSSPSSGPTWVPSTQPSRPGGQATPRPPGPPGPWATPTSAWVAVRDDGACSPSPRGWPSDLSTPVKGSTWPGWRGSVVTPSPQPRPPFVRRWRASSCGWLDPAVGPRHRAQVVASHPVVEECLAHAR